MQCTRVCRTREYCVPAPFLTSLECIAHATSRLVSLSPQQSSRPSPRAAAARQARMAGGNHTPGTLAQHFDTLYQQAKASSVSDTNFNFRAEALSDLELARCLRRRPHQHYGHDRQRHRAVEGLRLRRGARQQRRGGLRQFHRCIPRLARAHDGCQRVPRQRHITRQFPACQRHAWDSEHLAHRKRLADFRSEAAAPLRSPGS